MRAADAARQTGAVVQWSREHEGVLELPSGRLLRGRSARTPLDGERADLTLLLAAFAPRPVDSGVTWIRWPDFGLPTDRGAAMSAMHDAWARSVSERVEVVCRGGRGRTGTALACIAVMDGMSADSAIDLVRRVLHRRAIETPWQAGFVRGVAAGRLDP
jgi:protein-tyrosine phosphatase